MPVPKRARAKKHHGEDGVIKTGLACINCKEAKKKCERAGMSSERWYAIRHSCLFTASVLDMESASAYCLTHSLSCLQRKKSFQGYRKDRRNGDASALDPITQHREEILSQLSLEERYVYLSVL